MARTREEIQADMDRLTAELAEADAEVSEAVEEMAEVVDEAIEAHEEATEDAADEVVDEVVEAIEEAAEEVIEESPLADEGDEPAAERDVVAEVIARLEERYDLTPRAVVTTEEVAVEEVTTPQPEHWTRRKVW